MLLLRHASISFVTTLLFSVNAAHAFLLPTTGTTTAIKITAYGIHFGGKIVYRYQVENNSLSVIKRVELGFSEESGKELPGKPWELDAKYDVEGLVPLSAAECKPFTFMNCQISVFQFDYMPTAKSRIVMEGIDTRLVPAPTVFSDLHYIRPNTKSSVAELTIPLAYQSAEFMSATGLVALADTNSKNSNGSLILEYAIPFTKLDVTPPALTVTLAPATVKATGGMVTVNATVAVKDDYDPAPEIKLVSITPAAVGDVMGATFGTDNRQFQVRAQTIGAPKTYFVIYSATDGSGNTSQAAATITITP